MTTNALRLAKAAGITVQVLEYPVDESDLSAGHVAAAVGLDPDRVFKTLVCTGERGEAFVCVVPGSLELNLKKAASAAGHKACALLPLRELEGLTGYQRGGCSPVGLKKKLPVFLDETAALWDSISVSAGARGAQMVLAPADLLRLAGARWADLV
ncbi:MAG: aminoacyl-tRNA deacylase [Spirochaetes bacterium GWD1_61_31]|nr:MAG: aminoacyl-tRNA deacylase [Spirochaetes bacterium GWB1_60_80]OHD29129.1 MAG: aminoacyl-tRNA deacylase [Spirochaetes bacterium GWC1_61_12]OHD35309.1 MAG: aminoacyl-tRNA deacylase [Spirochaetes bacterium GWD1_61_31]OHD43757.1 MAG: aminoacyl-tRNA deacylase [Spirochaetes bacterium GWE1_60_18]OHD60262.1 MAG: aminoacyl-tRNA deacylase [Spirochaetes bacterium GWF1_60_12]HAP42547.1 Cys-tRNA(Pro) deacylase [Spirochaetaceae bacterium]